MLASTSLSLRLAFERPRQACLSSHGLRRPACHTWVCRWCDQWPARPCRPYSRCESFRRCDHVHLARCRSCSATLATWPRWSTRSSDCTRRVSRLSTCWALICAEQRRLGNHSLQLVRFVVALSYRTCSCPQIRLARTHFCPSAFVSWKLAQDRRLPTRPPKQTIQIRVELYSR